MHISVFKSVRTIDDMKNRLGLIQEFAKEHNTSYDKLLGVDGTDYYDLTYALSASKNGYITSNYFTYKDEITKCVGVCELPTASEKFLTLTMPIYNKLITLHPLLWLGIRLDGLYDVILRNRVIATDIISYDVLAMGESVQFLQLDSADGTSLVCLDMWNNVSGVTPISTKEEFKEWFELVVMKRGYEGKLDNLPISGLFQIYFEVINTIFEVSKFKPIVL